MAETVGKISLQRRGTFYDSTAPRSFTVKSERNSFYHGAGGGTSSMFTRRCGAKLEETIVVVSPRVLILARNGGVAIYGDVWTIRRGDDFVGNCWKKWDGRGDLRGRFRGICSWFCWIAMGGEWYLVERIIFSGVFKLIKYYYIVRKCYGEKVLEKIIWARIFF